MFRLLQISLACCALAAPVQALTTFSGYDAGAGSLGTAPNSVAAAASFDAAAGSLNVIDFEGATPGFSASADAYVTNVAGCAAALCGYNTTSGGQNFLAVTYNTTLSFDAPIEAFGAYFTGVQRGDATLTYADGSTVVLDLPASTINDGGTYFFGFIDLGASIVSIDYFTGTGGDYVGVDDIRFGTVSAPIPLPASLPLLGAGVAALMVRRRRRATGAA